ncbi:hypothetical protein ACFE04_011348 [Oxalis oulophora]
MAILHHTIEIMGYEGFNCVYAWREEGRIDIYVEHTIVDKDESNTSTPEHHENDKLNQCLAKARGYIDEAAIYGNTKRNAVGKIVDDDLMGTILLETHIRMTLISIGAWPMAMKMNQERS